MNEIIKIQSGKDIFKSVSKETAEPRQAFGKFIYEGELSLMFGDSNTGKSILANDIAFFVSGGGHDWGFQSLNVPSLYIDMELTTQQFVSRYINADDYLPETYSRAEVNVASYQKEEDFLKVLRRQIILMQGKPNSPKFIIIDNITKGFGSIFSPKTMKAFITELKSLKDGFGLTILLIAHCHKRNPNKPITENDLGGTKFIYDFVDSAFAIANTVHDERVKYLKQIKRRTGEKEKNVDTILLSQEPYLCFKPLGTEAESCCISDDLSIDMTKTITPQQELRLLQMLVEDKMKNYEIADEVGLTMTQVIQYALANGLRI